jgi:hypothetical protein
MTINTELLEACIERLNGPVDYYKDQDLVIKIRALLDAEQSAVSEPMMCLYGDDGYACCEDGPCQADFYNDSLAAPPAAPLPEPLTKEEYTALAHRIASKYAHRSDPQYIAYTFLPHTLEDFVRAIEKAHNIGAKE